MRGGLPWIGAAALMIGAAFLLQNQGYYTDQYRKLMLVVALALGFNFLFGIAGQIAFSHYAFYGLGAYGVVILTVKLGWPLLPAIAVALALCVVLAALVGYAATRLEGFYLALATLAFAQLFLVLLTEGGALTGGAGGIAGYTLERIVGFAVPRPWYTAVIAVLLLGTFAILWRLDRSYFGRACRAVRDNPHAAAAMGVDVALTKILAFTLTSGLAGLAGIVYAFVDNIVSPPVFGLEYVFQLLFMIIIGGSGRFAGAVIGAVLLYLLPFLLSPYIGHHHALAFGVVVVVVILVQPKGIMGVVDALMSRARGRPARPAAASP
jgi:branched-chain amino acid transport system permease protein